MLLIVTVLIGGCVAIRLDFRKVAENITGFDWEESNRARHFAKHGIDFPIVRYVSWAHILKARDWRKRYLPPRFVALGYCSALDRVLVIVYSKNYGTARIISVRLANEEEATLFHAR